MQVANALNNNIRILFNPRVEAFKLFDFLIVKSDEDKYLAQIIEIYDDKFDASQNVAKLKLFYKIAQNNEVMPYDNFTPNKECEIIKIKQEEVENFINNDKKTFAFGTNIKSLTSLNVQYDFFNKNCVVLADKIEHANAITLNLAKNLSQEKHVIILDSTGVIEFDEAKKIKASKNFKMPLNYTTITYVFQKLLSDASLEFQAIGGEILNEIKKFARKQEGGFIPFNAFTRVLLEQHKATPYKELRLLLARIKNCQMDEIFARTKKDVDTLFKTIEKSPITIVDLSSVDYFWQKAYLEYIISDIQQDVYLISRVNDENCDVELISKIYNEKHNISFVPNVSYNYKKLPTILQYCKNYILMPSLYQRSDFLDANFALANLISDGCILFGENTDNFLYLACDYELEIQEKRKNYRKIALTLTKNDEDEVQQNLGQKGDYFENQEALKKTHSQRLIEELSNFEKEQSAQLQEKANENFDNALKDEDEFDIIENNVETKETSKPQEEIIEEFDAFENITNDSQKTSSQDDFQTLDETIENTIQDEIIEEEEEEEEEEVIEIVQEENIEESFEDEFQVSNETQSIESNEIETIEEEFNETIIQENEEEIKQEEAIEEIQTQETIEETSTPETIENIETQEEILEIDILDNTQNNISQKNPEETLVQEEEIEQVETLEETPIEEQPKTFADLFNEDNEEEISVSKTQEINILDTDLIDLSQDEQIIPLDEPQKEDVVIQEETKLEELPNEVNILQEEVQEEISAQEITQETNVIQEEIQEEVVAQEEISQEENTAGISDEELDFFQIAQESSFEENESENVVVDDVEYKTTNETTSDKKNDTIDLEQLAEKSIDNSFEQIINTKEKKPGVQTLNIDDIEINLNIPDNTPEKDKLPIFKEDIKDKKLPNFEVGSKVEHPKFGIGTVIETKLTGNVLFLNIDFGEENGIKSIEPIRAKLKLIE